MEQHDLLNPLDEKHTVNNESYAGEKFHSFCKFSTNHESFSLLDEV